MAEKPIKIPLPADLPEDWNAGQIIAPDGTAVGLTERHGYNYLMAAVNRAQRGVNEVNEAFGTVSGKRTCRVTVGTSTAGWTEADCDYLCDGTDDQVEINLAAADDNREIVLLDGTYKITGQIKVKYGTVLRGNGPGTILCRASESMSGSPNTQDATIVLENMSELRNLVIESDTDAPNAAHIYCENNPIVSSIIFNTDWDSGSLWGKHIVGIGVYVNDSYIQLRIINCIFGNVTTAIYLNNPDNAVINGCSTLFLDSNNAPRHVPFFIQGENISKTIISDNIFPTSAIKIDVKNDGVIISNNLLAQILVTNVSPINILYSSDNLISGNALSAKWSNWYDTHPGITLGENTSGWFVTGNMVQNQNAEPSSFPIIDNGVNNIIRFNSDDPGGSTPATVQQATPSITVNADGTVTARATQAAGYVAAGTRSATYQLSNADDTDLTPENIKDGVSIFGVVGTLETGGGTAGVTSFNGRSGEVRPGNNDYTADMVGAVASSAAKDIQAMTQAEYDALASKSPTTLYLIKE